MFTGALAASYYGRARTTGDIDVVVAVRGRGWRTKLVSALRQAGLVVDEKNIDDALKSGYRIVTFKDKKSPLTVDVILSSEKLEKNLERFWVYQLFIRQLRILFQLSYG
ncbi:MAG TPA: hypothetical protein ENF90_01055 [Candidatus Bathyarchaeota archaeon]|nr:hypothetical protein [Candidatus Bathyarchaeota archaeon]